MNLEQAKQLMLRTHIAALQDGAERATAVEWESGPGVGKSEANMQYAAELAVHLGEPVGVRVLVLATITSADVNGFGLPVKESPVPGMMGFTFSLPPWYPVPMNLFVVEPSGKWSKPGTWNGETPRVGILFLDEFGQADDDVKKPAAELLLKGRVGNVELPEGWRVVAASNRMSDRSGVVRALTFIVNRRMSVKIDARPETWLAWANTLPPEQRPHYLVMSFAQKHPEIVFRDAVPAGSDPFCTPRTLCMLDRNLKALRSDDDVKRNRLPMDMIAREAAIGLIGAGEAAQFYSHVKYADELPELADIVKDPMKAKCPSTRDAQMVCGYFLAHHVDDKSAEPILRYISRLHTEMQVLTVRTITSQQDRAKTMTSTPLFGDWLLKNKNLLVASKS